MVNGETFGTGSETNTLRKVICFLRAAMLECRTLDAERFHTYLLTLDADPKAIVDECCKRGWLRGPWRRFDREALRSDPARYELFDAIATTELPDAGESKKVGRPLKWTDKKLEALLVGLEKFESEAAAKGKKITLLAYANSLNPRLSDSNLSGLLKQARENRAKKVQKTPL